MLSWRYLDETLYHLRYSGFPRKVSTDKTAVMASSLLPTRSCLLVDTCRWFPGSVPRWPWVAASSLWHIVKLFRYWGMSGSGKRSHMDQTIRLRSSHVGVSRCLRLIRYSFEKCVQCLLEWFGWTVGHISQFWWQGIKEHGASYSETSISYRLNCWWGLILEEQGNTFLDVFASENLSHNSLASQNLERVVPVCSTQTWWCIALVSSQGNCSSAKYHSFTVHYQIRQYGYR